MDTFRLSELEGTALDETVTVRGARRPVRLVPAAVVLMIEAAFPFPRVPVRLAENQGSKGTRTEPDHEDPGHQEKSAACSCRRAAARVAWALNMTTVAGLAPPRADGPADEGAANAYFLAAAAELLAKLSVREIDEAFAVVSGVGLVKQAERAAGN